MIKLTTAETEQMAKALKVLRYKFNPVDMSKFEGVVAIPIGFRNPGESDCDVIARYIDSLEEAEKNEN